MPFHSDKASFVKPLLIVLGLAAFPFLAHAQPSFVAREDWFHRKEQQQIPWRLTITKTSLGLHQRPRVHIEVVVSAASLLRTGREHDLVLFVRVLDSRTSQRIGEMLLRAPAIQGMPRRGQLRLSPEREVVFSVPVMVMPGKYVLGIVLWDRATDRLSIARKSITVKSLKDDPLPAAWQNLPRVEFFAPAGSIDLDVFYGPLNASPLKLALNTSRRLNLELVGDYDGPAVFLPLLRVLSELHIPNGSLTVSILDLSQQQIVFQQDRVSELDWPRLRGALDEITNQGVSLNCYRCPSDSSRFFRDFLARRMCASRNEKDLMEPDGISSESVSDNSLSVLILLTAPKEFEPGSEKDLRRDPACAANYARVIQILYAPPLDWDPLGPDGAMVPSGSFLSKYSNEWARFFDKGELRVFRIFTPMDFRRALAAVIAEIEHQGGSR